MYRHTIFTNYGALIYRHIDCIANTGRLLSLIPPEKQEDGKYFLTKSAIVCVIAQTYADGIGTILNQLVEHVQNAFGKAAEEFLAKAAEDNKIAVLNDTLFTLGLKIFKLAVGDPMPNEKEKFLAESFRRGFYKGRWAERVKANNMEEFVISYLKALPADYYIKLLKRYMQATIKFYREAFEIQFKLLSGKSQAIAELYLDKETLLEQETLFPRNDFFLTGYEKHLHAPDIKLLSEYLGLLLDDVKLLSYKA